MNIGSRRFEATRISAALCSLVAGALVAAGVATPVRAVATLLALTFGTGLALTGWIWLSDGALFWTITLGVGVAVSLLVSFVAVEVGWWQPVATVISLLALSVGSLTVQVLQWPKMTTVPDYERLPFEPDAR